MAIGTAAPLTTWNDHDAVRFGILVLFGAIVVEFTRGTTEPAGLIKEVHAAWQLPIAFLLPPVYCLIAPVITFGLLQVRTRRTVAHRRALSAASNGLSLGAASIAFHVLPTAAGHPLLWLLALTGCALLWSAVNKTLVMTAVRGADPTISIRQKLFTRGPVLNDVCEIAAAAVVTGVITGIGPILLIPVLPLVIVLQWSFRHAQLVSRARLDSHTGLLNAASWRAEVGVRINRAQQDGSPVALGLIDLDHFRAVNDAHGRKAGDVVLAEVAAILAAGLRSSDLIGRFGGEEFAFLLPGSDTGEALRVAERLRSTIAEHPIAVGPGGPSVHITLSIGLATTDDLANRDLTDLITAADAALYSTKKTGCDRVRLASVTNQPDAEAAGPAEDQPADEDPNREREEIKAARRALGRQLATWRSKAKVPLSQTRLAGLAGYSRSMVSSAEAGEPASAGFWAAVDPAVGAGGQLIAEHTRIEAAIVAAKRRAAQQSWLSRAERASAEVSGDLPEGGAIASADSACPRCGEQITVTGSFRVTAVLPQRTGAPSGSTS